MLGSASPGIIAAGQRQASAPAIVRSLSYTNLGAESGSSAGWTGTVFARTGGGGYPSARTGTYYFWFGSGGSAYQNHACASDEIAAIDAGAQWIELTHYFRGVDVYEPSANDCGLVFLEFYDASSSLLGELKPPGPFFGPYGKWALASYRGVVPVGTRTIRLVMKTDGFAAGASRDFYVDDLAVAFIAAPTPSERWFVNLDAEQGSWGWVQSIGAMAAGSWGPSYPPYEGDNYFTGVAAPECVMTQTIDVDASRYAAIDAGELDFALTWRERFYVSDTGQVLVRYLDSGGAVISTMGSSVAGGPGSWTLRSFTGTIPSGTRKLQLYVRGVRADGSVLDFYVDAITAAYA